MEKPNFQDMSLAQLLEQYNRTAPSKRKAAFSTKEEGVRRVEAEWERTQGQSAPAANANQSPPVAGIKTRQGRGDWKIEIKNAENPHREGTRAHAFYEAIKASPTVGEFMARYPDAIDKRDARIWLGVHKKSDRVGLVP